MKAFDWSGLASVGDFRESQWPGLFSELEARQAVFSRHLRSFRSDEYKWPSDPLHTWSRCWEYPYVVHHLRHARTGWGHQLRRTIADVGSGVTFLPFLLADDGNDVVCTDADPVCAVEFSKATPLLAREPGRVAFRLTVDGRLPFADEEVDAACCVSVVEHVEDQTRLLEELARILIRGGILVLTVDLGLRDGEALSVEGFNGLRRALESSFDLAVPERTIHPRDTLTPDRGPYGTGGQTFAQRLTSSVRDGVTFLRHGRVYRLRPRSLCVAGFVYRKR